jgi:hypothetical protein
MSMFKKIEQELKNDCYLSWHQLSNQSLFFVPGHAGDKGNWYAEMLVGLATVQARSALNRIDVLNEPKETRAIK